MLDKVQASVTQSTIVNATNLACAIVSRVAGVSFPNKVHGESITRNTINRYVLESIKLKHLTAK